MRRTSLLFYFALAGLFTAASAGCNAFSSNQPGRWNGGTTSNVTAAAMGPMFTVEMRGEGKKPEAKQASLEGEIHVQQALEKSGAMKRYRRMNVEIVRTSPKGNRHKMAVAFDSAKRQIEPQCDYALHPGDVIIVTEDSSTIIDDMFQGIMGPSGGKIARQSVSG